MPQIYERLRQLIVELRLKPRVAISKAEFAKRFGVSETPVREALLRLENEGLVVIKPQSGTFIAPINVTQASEARFLRFSIEIEVVKQLCKTVDEQGASELRSILARQCFHLQNSNLRGFSNEDSTFHRAMYHMVGVGGLWRSVRSRRAHFTRLRMLDIPQPGTMELILKEHEAIFEAVRDRDAVAAEAAVRNHLSGTVAPIETLKAKYPEYF
jgi:DNA-binding GntR family transcriptional regulator